MKSYRTPYEICLDIERDLLFLRDKLGNIGDPDPGEPAGQAEPAIDDLRSVLRNVAALKRATGSACPDVLNLSVM